MATSTKIAGEPKRGIPPWLGITSLVLVAFIIVVWAFTRPNTKTQSAEESGGGVVTSQFVLSDVTPEMDADRAWEQFYTAGFDAQVAMSVEQRETFTGKNGSSVVSSYTSNATSCEISMSTIIDLTRTPGEINLETFEFHEKMDRPCSVLDFVRGFNNLARQIIKRWPELKLGQEMWDKAFRPAIEDLFEISERFFNQYRP